MITCIPRPKGEGATFTVAIFVAAAFDNATKNTA
jgi:hypothetical protein